MSLVKLVLILAALGFGLWAFLTYCTKVHWFFRGLVTVAVCLTGLAILLAACGLTPMPFDIPVPQLR